jgi:hypothetical protein
MKNKDTQGNHPTKIYTYLHRRRAMKVLALSSLVPALSIIAGDPAGADGPNKIKTRKDSKMESIHTEPANQIKLPPLDAAMPAETRTATFAMG